MFSGIVIGTGTVTGIGAVPGAALRLIVDTSVLGRVPQPGESIAVSGTCLTVVEASESGTSFDAIAETLRCTTLGSLVVGALVNLEGALRVGDLIGGHQVQGHVDGVGRVRSVDDRGDEVWLTIEAPPAVLRTLVHKGWVTVEGASLTVNAVLDDAFCVSLIPATLALTTLGDARPGTRVNLEGDPLGKHVMRWLEAREEQA
jgi:riboflavin synthase